MSVSSMSDCHILEVCYKNDERCRFKACFLWQPQFCFLSVPISIRLQSQGTFTKVTSFLKIKKRALKTAIAIAVCDAVLPLRL